MGCQRNLCRKEIHWWASILTSRVRNGTETGINSCLMEHLAGLRLLVLTLRRTRLHQDYGCPKDAPSLKSAQRNFLQGCSENKDYCQQLQSVFLFPKDQGTVRRTEWTQTKGNGTSNEGHIFQLLKGRKEEVDPQIIIIIIIIIIIRE